MSAIVKEIRFSEGRKHRFRNPKSSAKGLSTTQIYERKQAQRRQRAAEITRNERLEQYINWICGIQTKLGLSNSAFAFRLGVTCQTIKLWKRKSGHFPSERSYKRLLELEIESRIPVRIIKIRYGVRM